MGSAILILQQFTHSPSLTFFLECAALCPNLWLPRLLAAADAELALELAFTEAALLVSAGLALSGVDSARADWIKLDMLWIGPLKEVPYLPMDDDADFDAHVLVGRSVVTTDFFFFRMSGSNSVK